MWDTHFKRRWHRSSTMARGGGMSSLLTRRMDKGERSPSNAWLKDYGRCRQARVSELGMGRNVVPREHSFHQSASLQKMHSPPNLSGIISSPSVTDPCPAAFNVEHGLGDADESQVEGILALRLLQKWHAFGQDDDQAPALVSLSGEARCQSNGCESLTTEKTSVGPDCDLLKSLAMLGNGHGAPETQTGMFIAGSPNCEVLRPSRAEILWDDSKNASLTIQSNFQCSKEAFPSDSTCDESTLCRDASLFHDAQLCLESSIQSNSRACDLAMQDGKLAEVSRQMKEPVEVNDLKLVQADGISHSMDSRRVPLDHSTTCDLQWDWWMHELDSNHVEGVKPSLQECQKDVKKMLPSCESRKAKTNVDTDIGSVDKDCLVKRFAEDKSIQLDDEEDVEELYLIREPKGAETSDTRGFVDSSDEGRTGWLETDSNIFSESECCSGEIDEHVTRLYAENSLEETKEDDIWSDEDLICSQAKGFPPPISILANESHPGLPSHMPRTIWRSVKKDGRFVLQEVQACPREFFRATRENGCLKLQLVRPDSDADEMLEGRLDNSQPEEVVTEYNQNEYAYKTIKNQNTSPRISSDSWISSVSEGMDNIVDESKFLECGSSTVWSDTQLSNQSISDSCCPTREATHLTAPHGDKTMEDCQHFHGSYGLDNHLTKLSPTQSFLPIPYTAMQPAVR